jgi:hypothetical protein
MKNENGAAPSHRSGPFLHPLKGGDHSVARRAPSGASCRASGRVVDGALRGLVDLPPCRATTAETPPVGAILLLTRAPARFATGGGRCQKVSRKVSMTPCRLRETGFRRAGCACGRVKNRCRACLSHGRGDDTHAVWSLQRIHSPVGAEASALVSRCRAHASCRPRLDPSARKGWRTGWSGALAPLDDRAALVWMTECRASG